MHIGNPGFNPNHANLLAERLTRWIVLKFGRSADGPRLQHARRQRNRRILKTYPAATRCEPGRFALHPGKSGHYHPLLPPRCISLDRQAGF